MAGRGGVHPGVRATSSLSSSASLALSVTEAALIDFDCLYTGIHFTRSMSPPREAHVGPDDKKIRPPRRLGGSLGGTEAIRRGQAAPGPRPPGLPPAQRAGATLPPAPPTESPEAAWMRQRPREGEERDCSGAAPPEGESGGAGSLSGEGNGGRDGGSRGRARPGGGARGAGGHGGVGALALPPSPPRAPRIPHKFPTRVWWGRMESTPPGWRPGPSLARFSSSSSRAPTPGARAGG